MRARLVSHLAALLLAAGTAIHAQAGTPQPAVRSTPFTPREAIVAAADAADAPAPRDRVVRGVFEMPVRATGRQDNRLYLNSERDYRDQRNLTIAIAPDAEAGVRDRLGGDPATLLVGRRVRVTGAAQRVTIWIWDGAERTDKYYYQTHVRVVRADQLFVLPDSAALAPPAAAP